MPHRVATGAVVVLLGLLALGEMRYRSCIARAAAHIRRSRCSAGLSGLDTVVQTSPTRVVDHGSGHHRHVPAGEDRDRRQRARSVLNTINVALQASRLVGTTQWICAGAGDGTVTGNWQSAVTVMCATVAP